MYKLDNIIKGGLAFRNYVNRTLYTPNQMEQNNSQTFIITQKAKKINNRSGNQRIESLYEEVIHKNFTTIDEMLKKLNATLIKTQEIEGEISALVKRMGLLELNLETIHNEHRRDNVLIHSNFTGIKGDITSIDSQVNIICEGLRGLGVYTNLKRDMRVGQTTRTPSLQFSHLGEVSLDYYQKQNQAQAAQNLAKEENKSAQEINQSQNLGYINLKEPVKGQKTLKQNNSCEKKRPLESEKYSKLQGKEGMKKIIKKIVNQFDVQPEKRSSFSLESNEGESFDLASLLAKNNSKIHRIMRRIKDKSQNQQQIRQKLRHIVGSMIKSDPKMLKMFAHGSKKSDANQEEIAQYFCQFLFNFMFLGEQNSSDFQQSYSKEGCAKMRELYRKIQQIQLKVEGLNEKDKEILKEQKKIQDALKQKSELLLKQIQLLNQSSKNFVTVEKIYQQSLKSVETSKKLWTESKMAFANRDQTIKALQYLQRRIKAIVMNSNKNQRTQYGSEQQDSEKCLCCTRPAIKMRDSRINLSAYKSAVTTPVTQADQAATTRRTNHELKKKTLEFMKKDNDKKSRLKTFANKEIYQA